MKLSVISCLLALAALMLAQGAHAGIDLNRDSCCKKGFFCCGEKCMPSWKKRLGKLCPTGHGCCKPKDPCKERPFVVGPCRAAFRRYSFNPRSKQCELFIYGGCKGNGNNFKSKADCIEKCDVDEPCICLLDFAPVCVLSENKEFTNKCVAACEGFTEDELTKGPCPKKEPQNCCPKKTPVCCGDGCITKKQALATLCPIDGLCGCPKH